MKITNIKLTQKRTLADWESLEFSADAIVEEEDKVQEVTDRLWDYVDWYAQKYSRDAKKRTYDLALADENTDPEKRVQAEKWLAVYEKRRATVEAM